MCSARPVYLTNQENLFNVRPMAASLPLDVDRAVPLFHALSDPIRLSIMELLRGGERCVCDLQDDLDTAQSKLSFHLKVLKDAGLVSDRREGRWSYYTIVPEALAEVHDLTVGMTPKKGTLPILRTGSCCG